MKILALDLGKYKTVGCAYESESGAHQFQRTFTAPADLQRLVQDVKPDRVVIEVCSIAGWVCDLMGQLGIEVQVANTSITGKKGLWVALLEIAPSEPRLEVALLERLRDRAEEQRATIEELREKAAREAFAA